MPTEDEDLDQSLHSVNPPTPANIQIEHLGKRTHSEDQYTIIEAEVIRGK